jgi:hypothetical protein
MRYLVLAALAASVSACADDPEGPSAPLVDGFHQAKDGSPLDHTIYRSYPEAGPVLPDSSPSPLDSGPPNNCTAQETYFNGHCYLLTGVKWIDYATATQLCAMNNGQVASIQSAAENKFVFGLLHFANQAVWIGLKRQGQNFAWVDGSAVGYLNWAPGEPNNEDGTENCSVMWGPALKNAAWHGLWNDVPCGDPGRDTVVCKRKD